MNKKFIPLVFSLVLLTTIVSANVDEWVKVDYCEIALSDTDVSEWEFENAGTGTPEDSIFKEWDNTDQEGVIINITNLNTILEEDSDYEIQRLTPEIDWWAESFYPSTEKTKLPIINVQSNPNKYVYIKCQYITGEQTIFLNSLGYYDRGYVTSDFNLTTGLPETKISSDPPLTGVSNSLELFSSAKATWVNNFNPEDRDVLLPETTPYIIYKSTTPLGERPKSYDHISLSWLLRTDGNINLVSNPFTGATFYINSSISPALKASINMSNITITKDGSSEKYVGSNQGLKIEAGETYQISIPFYNPYNDPITNKFTYFTFADSWPRIRGISSDNFGEEMPDEETILTVPRLQSSTSKTTTQTIQPGETIYIQDSYTIPNEEVTITNLRESISWIDPTDSFGTASAQWPYIGSDEYPYLSFGTIDPRVEMKWFQGQYLPIFNITIELIAEDFKYTKNISAQDYQIDLKLKNNSLDGISLYNESKPVETEIIKSIPEFISFEVPIEETWSNGKIYIQILANMTKAISPYLSFEGKYISLYSGSPYFKPGKIAYQHGDTLRFGPTSRIDSQKITILNSDTDNEHDFKVSVQGISSENFTTSWNGITFEKEPGNLSLHLYPEQSKEITFWVNATYDPWVSQDTNETMNITIIPDSEDTLEEMNFTYNLYVEDSEFNWTNLIPLEFEITNPTYLDSGTLYLDQNDSVKTETITFYWEEQGSEPKISELMGTKYWVNLTILEKRTSGDEILKSIEKQYTFGDSLQKYISTIYQFNNSDYKVKIELDTKDNITKEKTSTFAEGESDNTEITIVPIMVTGCTFKESDNKLYRIDYFGDEYLDTENICECPSELTLILGKGYCADPWSDCSGFSTLDNCNNNLNHPQNQMCGWECDGDSCPPENEQSGICLSCMNITGTCAGYNNQDTCEEDPCQKASLYDCKYLSCDRDESFGCYWDSSENKCEFEGTVPDGGSGINCEYDIDVLQECTGANDYLILDYQTVIAGCKNKQVKILCGTEISTLPFFSKISMILAIALLSLVYFKNKRN